MLNSNIYKLFLINCMKNQILIILILFFSIEIYGQDKIKIYSNLGVKYTPLEYLGGPLVGLSVGKPNGKLMWNFRKDIIFSIEKLNYGVNNNLIFNLTNYHTYNYLDVDYKFSSKASVFIGGAWIYEGKTHNTVLNSQSGYYAATLGLKYKIDWLTFELRGDIPLEKYVSYIDQGHLFPVSFALYYKFRPKREN